MKNIFKLSLSLFFNQILGSTAAAMCVLFTTLLFGNELTGHFVFLAITFTFFTYIQYRAAFKYGFHDADRRNNPNSRLYVIKGAFAGLISAIPLMLLISFYIFCLIKGYVNTSMFAILYTRIASMYYCWPMCNIFPNHILTVLLTSILPLTVIPCIGYVAGYKNIMIFDYICRILRIKPKV